MGNQYDKTMEENDYKDMKVGKREEGRNDSFMIKAVLWFIALCVAGCVVCVILGALKVAIQAVVIVAAVLMFIALLGWVGYEKIKARMTDRDSGPTD